MKYAVYVFFFVFGYSIYAQNGYWQQAVDYTIDAKVDDVNDILDGKETLIYTNNSPDTLKVLFFHLYWNAMKKGTSANQKLGVFNSIEGDSSDDDFGQIDVLSVNINGEIIPMKVFETIGQVPLKQALVPGANLTLTVVFRSKIPSCFNRCGKNNASGTDYTFTQWYPKLCRYDRQGWHTDPYFGREFAGSFGKFKVNVECNASFTVAGTGTLMNKKYLAKGWKNLNPSEPIKGKTNWVFTADKVHDFAFAMDREWVHQSQRIDSIDFHFFYNKNYETQWTNLATKWQKSYAICKREFGTYPYPQFSFIQAGEGYMEYPMCTMLEGSYDFYSTACHEFMHSYFYGIYGSDENLYHWMDEGLTQFAEARVSDIDGIKETIRAQDIAWGFSTDEPISTAANHFAGDYSYFYAAYNKGQLFAEIMQYIIGKEAMRQGFGKYYRTWKFKHPEPNDFVKVMEDASGMELTWFQNYWLNTSKPIEIVIDSVWQAPQGLTVRLDNRGIPMPVEVEITLKNQTKKRYYIPIDLTNKSKSEFAIPSKELPIWSCALPSYTFNLAELRLKEVEKIRINPDGALPEPEEGGAFVNSN
ncbi:MAG: hypothetical protein RL110_636 [Bacteroidota bacterium]|jgi:hypothetical protein